MCRITLGEAVGFRLGGLTVLTSVNPFTRRVTVDKGSSTSFLTWEELKNAYGIEIVPTEQEKAFMEQDYSALQIEGKARELRSTIENWLLNEKSQMRSHQVNDRELGLYHKFDVKRTDGSSEPGGKHEKCWNFVLDINHDVHARAALKAYAESCKKDFPLLSADLEKALEHHHCTGLHG